MPHVAVYILLLGVLMTICQVLVQNIDPLLLVWQRLMRCWPAVPLHHSVSAVAYHFIARLHI